MSSKRQEAEQLAKLIRESKYRLLGTDFMPTGLEVIPELDQGPKGPLEKVQEFFGMRPEQDMDKLLGNLEGNLSQYRRAENRYLADQISKERERLRKLREESKAEGREDDAYNQQQILDTIKAISASDREGRLEELRTAGQVGTEQSIAQMQALYPYLRQAGIEGREGALDISQRYKAFKEMLPSSIQAIMESKQRQQQLASDAFAREAQAIATQQQAATGFGTQGIGRYSGRRIA